MRFFAARFFAALRMTGWAAWVTLALVMAAAPDGCVEGVATRHDAMARVLEVFPARAVAGVDGYVGVKECGAIGRVFWLWAREGASGRQWVFRVAAVDCLNQGQEARAAHEAAWGGRWVADVGLDLWQRAGLPGRPVSVMLCEGRGEHVTDIGKESWRWLRS